MTDEGELKKRVDIETSRGWLELEPTEHVAFLYVPKRQILKIINEAKAEFRDLIDNYSADISFKSMTEFLINKWFGE